MRRKLENILGVELRSLAIQTRENLGLTQREMGEKLQMSESSYSNIETGKNKCGMLTSILLLEMQRDPSDFLRNASHKVNEWYEGGDKVNLMSITYGIVEEMYTLGDDSRISYGIVAYSNADADKTATIVASIHDITNDKKRLAELVILCNKLQLSVIHINDIIEDFLTN